MDVASSAQSGAYAKAMAVQDALLSAFAKDVNKPKDRPDEKVVFNAAFQMLIAAQKNIDETRSPEKGSSEQRALLEEGVGQEIDTKA